MMVKEREKKEGEALMLGLLFAAPHLIYIQISVMREPKKCLAWVNTAAGPFFLGGPVSVCV